jgi:hypothetical protein
MLKGKAEEEEDFTTRGWHRPNVLPPPAIFAEEKARHSFGNPFKNCGQLSKPTFQRFIVCLLETSNMKVNQNNLLAASI